MQYLLFPLSHPVGSISIRGPQQYLSTNPHQRGETGTFPATFSSQPFGGKGKSAGEVPVLLLFISSVFIGVTAGVDKAENGW